jgi:integrase
MVAGHLREINGYYHIVLSYKDSSGTRKSPSFATGLPIKGNKRRAEALLLDMRKKFEIPTDAPKAEPVSPILFSDFLTEWLEMMQNNVELSTFASYQRSVQRHIVPYFKEKGILLTELAPRDIQQYYHKCLTVDKVSANTVIHYHANIRKALQYALKMELIDRNPADLVERPKIKPYEGSIYSGEELQELFAAVHGQLIEFAVITGAFYGLRRSEIVGLKWDAIDFRQKRITIRHTVTSACVDGKYTLIEKDRPKTKSSYRSLPLVAPYEKLLRSMQEQQEQNRKLCGKSYCRDYLEYIYVNEVGELVRPDYVSRVFAKTLEKAGMKKIRFHDLRHSCASLLYANGVSLKEIQEWLGHSNISTTSNIYTHLDFNSKVSSANAILGYYPQEKTN